MKLFLVIVFLIFSLIGFFVETNFQIWIGGLCFLIHIFLLNKADDFGYIFVNLFFIILIYFPLLLGNGINYIVNEKGFELTHFLR